MEAYPLKWPDGWPRAKSRQRSRFDVTPGKAARELLWEIERMGGKYPVISTNAELRRDGLPYANHKEPDDPGVAVYFETGGKQKVFACDKWTTVRDNMRAIQKTIEAIRGIERWGASEMMERAFSAFNALPPPKTWRDFFPDVSTPDDLKRCYREQAKKMHPDHGGSEAAMAELNAHYRDAAEELGA